jgi:hypothetical protein
MERIRPSQPEQKKEPIFTVYCLTEGKTIYQSSGLDKQTEFIVAQMSAQGHADFLGHKVYIFENRKLI